MTEKTPKYNRFGYKKLIKAIRNCEEEVQEKILEQYKNLEET